MELTFANGAYTSTVDQKFVDTFPGIQADNNKIQIRSSTMRLITKWFVDNVPEACLSFADLISVKRVLDAWDHSIYDNENADLAIHQVRRCSGTIRHSTIWNYWKILPEVIDWASIFARTSPTRVMKNILEDLELDFDGSAEVKRFFYELNFAHIFEENTDETAAAVAKYNKDRKENVDEYAIKIAVDDAKCDMTKLSAHRVYTGEILNSNKMSKQKRCPIGTPTMSKLSDATTRFHSYTNGLFLKSPNPEFDGMNFNWENVCVAGGSALKLLTPWTTNGELRSSDIDVFISGKTFHDRSIAFKRTLSWFEGPNAYFSVRGSVVTIFYKNMPRKIQLISISEKSPIECIHRFDFSHIAVAFVGDAWVWTPTSWTSICTQTSTLGNVHRWNPNRMYKAMVNGFDIAINDKLQATQMDFKEMLDATADAVAQLVADNGVWYYPRSEPDMTPEEERSYHISCIKKDTRAHVVGVSIDIVLKNILIGGSFDSDYAAMSFSNFDLASVIPKTAVRNTKDMLLFGIGGMVRLLTCDCTVSEAVLNEDSFRITLSPNDPKFAEFANTIETTVFKMYRQRGVHDTLMKNGVFVAEMENFRINGARNNGLALARTQRGEAVDLAEIIPGDIVQMMFNIKFVLNGVCCVNFMPIRFIKMTEYIPEQFDDVEPVKIDDEVVESTGTGEIEW